MIPFKHDKDGVAYFYTSQIFDYGEPYHFGFEKYYAIDDTSTPMVTDWTMEQERRTRPIHRYNRLERFTCILGQLCGYRGHIGDVPMSAIVAELVEPYTWESVRLAMKTSGYTKYYNRIPFVVAYMNKLPYTDEYQFPAIPVTGLTPQIYDKIITDFHELQHKFTENKAVTDRSYFPSLRYVALKLLQKHGATINIPLMRNKKTLDKMEDLWLLLELV